MPLTIIMKTSFIKRCMNNLRTHLYYHYEPKFICEFENCDKRFFMRKLLKAHMNVHRGQKDFMCNYCEKSYFFQSHLKRHIISTHMKLKIGEFESFYLMLIYYTKISIY